MASRSYPIDYAYFDGGAVEDIVYPLVPGASTRETVTYSYDGLGQPFDLIGDETYVDDAAWTVHGLPDLWTIGPTAGGTTRRWDYDAATLRIYEIMAGTTQLTGDTTRNLMRYRYSYDDSGNIEWIRDYRNSSQRECFAYDTNNRLTAAFTGDSTCTNYSTTGTNPYDETYAFDNLHNITSFDGTTHTYGTGNEYNVADAGPHAVVTAGSVTFAYDDNGNRISRTESGSTIDYTYNDDNRLAAVDLPSDPDDVEFVYDADGVRVSRSHGDSATVFIAGLMEIDLDDATVTETRTFYAFAGTPVAVRTHEDPATTYVFDNHLGSVSAAWDDTNDVHTLQRYYPWGADRGTTGALPSDHRYTGQISDDTSSASGGTGLLFYNARYYDPQVGAFVAADDLVPNPGRPIDFNRYLYVRGTPTTLADPTGHEPRSNLIDLGPMLRPGGGESPINSNPEPITEEEALSLFRLLARQGDVIAFEFPIDGCYERAALMGDILDAHLPGGGHFKVGNSVDETRDLLLFVDIDDALKYANDPNHPETEFDDHGIYWTWHIAPGVLVERGGTVEVWVLDPSLFTERELDAGIRPTVEAWAGKMGGGGQTTLLRKDVYMRLGDAWTPDGRATFRLWHSGYLSTCRGAGRCVANDGLTRD